ncbi:MAG: hypothetical protein ACFE7E_06735 [Candidatus Hodarchaeota archaeon]
MDSFKWRGELTQLAKKNQEYQSWAVVKPADMLKATRLIRKSAEGFPLSQKDKLREEIGTDNFDFLVMLKGLGFVVENLTSEGEKFYILTGRSQEPGSKQFFSGGFLAQDDIPYEEALKVVGHNFILKARESLEFCAALTPPGLTKEFLKHLFLDHIVFNNKLNAFKFDGLLEMLQDLGIIIEGEYGHVNHYSPAPLTFYCMTERYLLEADYEIGRKVHAGDLLEYIDRVIPERSEDYSSLGFSKFPFEGWGKYRTWLTAELFKEILQIGLTHPLSVAKILRNLIRQNSQDTTKLKNELLRLKKDRLDRIRKFEKPILGIEDVIRVYDAQ